MSRNTDRKTCYRCGEEKPRNEYSVDRDWQHADRVCDACRAEAARVAERKACSRCGEEKLRNEYSVARDWRHTDRMCDACRAQQPVRRRGVWQCVRCKIPKPKDEFSDWLARRARPVNDGTARCNVCRAEESGEARAMAADSLRHIQRHA